MGPKTADGRPPWRREMLDEKAPDLAAIFERHGVIAAYVFGSLAKSRDPRRVTVHSDLDLALLLPGDWTREARFRASGRVETEVARLFQRGDLDVVVANDAPIVLRQQIVRERDLVYGMHRPERVAFDWATSREYLDTQPLRRFRYAAMIRRSREGRFGVGRGSAAPSSQRA